MTKSIAAAPQNLVGMIVKTIKYSFGSPVIARFTNMNLSPPPPPPGIYYFVVFRIIPITFCGAAAMALSLEKARD